MHEEEQRSVVDAGQAGTETAVEALGGVLLFDEVLLGLPLDAVGRVGEHVVELTGRVSVAGGVVVGAYLGFFDAQRVTVDQVVDRLVFDEQIGAADGEGFGVVFLAEEIEVGVGILAFDALFGDGEHAAGACGGIIDAAVDAGFEDVFFFGEDEVDHEADDFARGEVIACFFVGLLVEFADQFLEDVAHLQVGDAPGGEVDLWATEFFDDEEEAVALVELLDLALELEFVEDVTGQG